MPSEIFILGEYIMKDRKVLEIVQMGILCALAFIFILLIRIPIFPAVPYLVYDPGDIPLLIGAFMFGPLPALIMTVVVAGLQALFLSADGLVGFLMHVLASGMLVIVAGAIYKKRRTRKGAAVSLIAGVLCMAAVMVLGNLVFTVNFYGVPEEVVWATMPFTIGFNLIKGAINSIIVFLIYKPLSRFFKKGRESLQKPQI